MNQWAMRNPEAYEEGVRYEDVHDWDRIRQEQKDNPVCKRCEGAGEIDRELLGEYAISVEACPDCRGTGRP